LRLVTASLTFKRILLDGSRQHYRRAIERLPTPALHCSDKCHEFCDARPAWWLQGG